MSTDVDDTARFRCGINQCPMTGGIYLNGPQAAGVCAWHHGSTGEELVRITQVLLDWDPLAYEINRWRSALMQVELDPAALAKAWTRLQPTLSEDFAAQLAPGADQSYAQWGHKLQAFLLGCVKDVIRRAAP